MTEQTDRPEPFDLVSHLLRSWKWIALATLVGIGGAVAYLFLAPPWYSATLTVVPSTKSMPNPTAFLTQSLPMDIGGSADVQRISAVLRSTSVADAVIEKFNLREHYEVSYTEQARQELAKRCVIAVDRRSAVVALTCEDKDPERAREMAAYFGEIGNAVFGRISASSAREERKFLEAQVVKAKSEVEEASQKLREFQEKHRIVDLPEQSKAVISAMASIQGEMISKQIELKYLSSFSARTEASVRQLEQQIAIMKSKLAQLESSRDPPTGDGKFFPEAMTVPALRYELEQIVRQQQIRETVYFLMTQRYETARVDEARDTSTFQILDTPVLPTYRSRPRRLKSLALGAVCGLAFGILVVSGPALLRQKLRPRSYSAT